MKKTNCFKIILNLLIVFLMMLTSFSNSVLAEGNTIADVGVEATDTNFRELPFDTKLLSNPQGIKAYGGAATEIMNNPDYKLNEGDSYYVEYPEALNYFDKMLTVRVDVQLTKLPGGNSVIYIKNNRINIGWDDNAQGAKTSWKITFIDPETNTDFDAEVLLGIYDPDESHYKYGGATGRLVAYKDAKSTLGIAEGGAIDNYVLDDRGIYRLDPLTKQIIDTETYRDNPDYFENALFLVETNASSFEFESDTICSGSIDVPYIWAKKYVITYDPNNETIVGNATGEMEEQIAKEGNNTLNENKYKAKGYEFKGWTLESGKKDEIEYIDKDTLKLDETDFADKPVVRTLYAQWEPIKYKLQYDPNEGYVEGKPVEHDVDGKMNPNPQVVIMGDNDLQENKYESKGYKFNGWNTKEDGSGTQYTNKYEVTAAKIEGKDLEKPIDTLYAQWKPKEYRIIYKPNDTDLKASVKNPDAMEDDKFDVVNNNPYEWNSDDHPWLYEIDGYTFVGYKIENKGDTINNPQDFKGYLLNEDHQEVKLYAQWEPWKYYIHYDGNGADNMNAMPSDVFEYFDDNMMSKENSFRRDGYRFDGFRVEVNGGVKIVWSPEEFAEILKELGPGSSVTLKAMWVKLPVRFQAPITGIE